MENVPAILEKQVVQTNPLIEARKYMNLSEMRLFILGLQGVKPHIKEDSVYDVEFQETWVSPNELKSLFANNDGSVNNMKRHIKNAFDGKIELSDGYGGYMLYHIYNKMHYVPEKGLLIKFDDEMKPYILDIIGKAYTTYSIKTMFPLSSEYAWRLLESLLEYQGFFKKGKNKVYCELSLDEVRFRLNVPEGQYVGRMSNFRSRVLDLPIKDINEKTEYSVWYDVLKTGRKVTGFRFWLEKKKSVKEIAIKQDDDSKLYDNQQKIYDRLVNRGISTRKAKSLIKKYDLSVIENNLRYAVQQKDTSTNLPGLIITFIEQDVAGQNAKAKKEAQEREAERQKDRRQAYEMFHGTAEVDTGHETEITTSSDELNDIEVEFIQRKGEKAGAFFLKKMERLGLTVEEVRAGKRK
ncbi:replication initiation protein [Pseudobutyrivibrio sp.]|uniref:replication initiation protein n=1 Tax=Pseudobutyrivibrio sp. TaxID=2014367 RepID=UPI001B3F44C9|nr:replication initiation protein [Pseudobutyrivibrio sp.]MBP3263243.1 replication initiation protein [Pseudobutyrivibrio sp.]